MREQIFITNPEYFALPRASASLLSNVAKNSKQEPRNSITNMGSLVDCFLFEQDFDAEFLETDFIIPETYLNAFEKIKEDSKEMFSSKDVLEYFRKIGTYSNQKDETILKNIDSHIGNFEKIFYEKRRVVTKELKEEAKEIVESIKNGIHWKSLFDDNCVFQTKFIGDFHGLDFKSMLDIYNEWDNIITDLKVTDARLCDYENQIAKKLMYPFKMAIYKDFVGDDKTKIQWLVYSTLEKRTMLMVCSQKDYEMGKFGNRYTIGYLDAIDLYKNYSNEQDYYALYYRTQGFLESNIYQ